MAKASKQQPNNVEMSDGLSFDDIRKLLSDAIGERYTGGAEGGCYVTDVYPSAVVYSEYGGGESKTFKASYIIEADGGVTLGEPVAVARKTSYEPVVQMAAFSMDDLDDGRQTTDDGTSTQAQGEETEYVVRWGKIFEAGEYPDKGFALTAEEMASAAAEFVPVNIGYEHFPQDHPLKDKLGELREVKVAEDGVTLLGGVAMPAWLDKVLPPAKRMVSTVWDRATKQLKGLDLTGKPRVSDAALMSAYAEFAESLSRTMDDGLLTMDKSETEAEKMSDKEKIETEKIDAPMGEENGQALAEMQAALSKSDADRAALAAQVETLSADKRQRDSEAFADGVIAEKKALPAEKSSMAALFSQAVLDDEKDGKPSGLATFSEGKQASRVEALRALYASRPRMVLDQELLKEELLEGDHVVLFNKSETSNKDGSPMSPERKKELLGMTPVGRGVMAETK